MKYLIMTMLLLTACAEDDYDYEVDHLPISISELTEDDAEIIEIINEYFDYELLVIDNENPDFELMFEDLEDGVRGRINFPKGWIKIDIETEIGSLRYKRTLEHELGHALGANHVDDPRSIMFHSAPLNNGEEAFEGYFEEVIDELLSDMQSEIDSSLEKGR